jgi:hypothetical protein
MLPSLGNLSFIGVHNKREEQPDREMAIPDEVQEVLSQISEGAGPLFATGYLADDMFGEHDETCRGERVIVGELLYTEKSMTGNPRSWFDQESFEDMISAGRAYDIVSVLDAMDNRDVSAKACYDEGNDNVFDDEHWDVFVDWRKEITRLSHISVMVKQLQMIIALKLYVIRFRKRVNKPDGAVSIHTAKRFRGMQV